jgi:hypothetical protein
MAPDGTLTHANLKTPKAAAIAGIAFLPCSSHSFCFFDFPYQRTRWTPVRGSPLVATELPLR